MHDLDDPRIHPDVKAICDHYQFDTMPVEGTLYKSTYRSPHRLANGGPAGTAIIGMYSNLPLSVSCFHKLLSDEVWHVFGGVAVYLAAMRPLEKLILLTPYDSVAAVAQGLYPLFPTRYLIRDRFDSASRAASIDVPVLIASAENDREIRLQHTLALKQKFNPALVEYQMITGAAHNDIIDYPEYRAVVQKFLLERKPKPDGS